MSDTSCETTDACCQTSGVESSNVASQTETQYGSISNKYINRCLNVECFTVVHELKTQNINLQADLLHATSKIAHQEKLELDLHNMYSKCHPKIPNSLKQLGIYPNMA